MVQLLIHSKEDVTQPWSQITCLTQKNFWWNLHLITLQRTVQQARRQQQQSPNEQIFPSSNQMHLHPNTRYHQLSTAHCQEYSKLKQIWTIALDITSNNNTDPLHTMVEPNMFPNSSSRTQIQRMISTMQLLSMYHTVISNIQNWCSRLCKSAHCMTIQESINSVRVFTIPIQHCQYYPSDPTTYHYRHWDKNPNNKQNYS